MATESHLGHLNHIVATESDLLSTNLSHRTTTYMATESHPGHLNQSVAMESARLAMA